MSANSSQMIESSKVTNFREVNQQIKQDTKRERLDFRNQASSSKPRPGSNLGTGANKFVAENISEHQSEYEQSIIKDKSKPQSSQQKPSRPESDDSSFDVERHDSRDFSEFGERNNLGEKYLLDKAMIQNDDVKTIQMTPSTS
jgi:hypothetical protein